MEMEGMGLYGAFGIFTVILGLIKEGLMIFILFKGIQVANVYINKNKDRDNKDNDKTKSKQDEDLDKLD